MKTLKYLFCLLFAGVSLSLAGCGGDDKDDNGDDNGNVTVGWKEEGNKLILTTKYNAGPYTLTEVLTFTFSGEKCTGGTAAITYPSSIPDAVLDIAFAELKKEYPSATKSGHTLTIPLPEGEWKDKTKSQIREAFEHYAGAMS